MDFAFDGDTKNSRRNVGVLVCGAGPSGLMAASLLSRYGIDFRIIDKASNSKSAGHSHSSCRFPLALIVGVSDPP